MLEFIIGRAGTGKTTYCLEAVQQKLIKAPQGKPIVILLPDHMTFAVERQLALLMKDYGGFSRAYVLGMSRLAYQILLRCGGALHPHLNEIGKQLLLSRVLSDTKLSILAKAARQQHFTSAVAKIIEEFKVSGVSVTQLTDVLQTIEDESLKQKLADLTIIYQGLDKQMQGHYHDSEDILSLATAKLNNCKWLKDAEFWIDGFDAFNPQHFKMIEQILNIASDVHLTLCIDDVDSSVAIEHEAETALFHRQYIVYKQVSEIARKLSIKIKITSLTENYRHNSEALSFIEQQLFKFPLTSQEYSDGLHIVEAANRRLECEAVAADILYHCREKGYRHYDIGILLRGTTEYSDLLQAVLTDYEIPFFSDMKRQSSHHPVAELIRSSLESLRTWQYEALFRAFKTDLFGLEREDIDYLENYVLSFGIRGHKRWAQQEDWRFSHNNHIDEDTETDIKDEAVFAKINDIRRRLMQPLINFYTDIQQADTVKDFTTALYNYLIALKVPETLTEWAKQAQEYGDTALAKEHQQIWNNIMGLMDQIVQTCGSDSINVKNYEQLINDGLDSIQIALIPPGYDYVTIASFEHNTLNNKRAIYILSANERLMPKHSKTEGLLSDAERMFMISAGINISEGTLEDNFAERYLLYKGFSLATDYLWVSYALADTEGAGQNKSMIVSRLRQILPQAQFTSIPLETIQQQSFLQVTTKRRSLSNMISALRKLREESSWQDFWQDVYNSLLVESGRDTTFSTALPLNTAIKGIFAEAPQDFLPPQLATQVYTKRNLLRGSITRFEQFYSCPFKHFAHYALNLQDRKEFSFAAPDLGILLHAVMRKFGDYLAAQNRPWSSVTTDECKSVCQKIITQLAPKLQNQILLSSNRYKHLLERINKLAVDSLLRLIEFSKHSSFKPKAFEQKFGLNSVMPPLLLDDEYGHKIEITGQIDRIDITDNYYLVIDYKSGKAFINLLEVYYGLRLQLMTYLLVAKNAAMSIYDMENAIPAGILYCFLKMPYLTSKQKLSDEEIRKKVEKEMRMPGWVLADVDIIRKIDDSSHFITVNFNKDNTIAKSSKRYLKTMEEFELLMQYIELTLKDAGKRILQGETRIYPYKIEDNTACQYCPYLAVCRFDTHVSGYDYREINKLDDTEIMQMLQTALGEENSSTDDENLQAIAKDIQKIKDVADTADITDMDKRKEE